MDGLIIRQGNPADATALTACVQAAYQMYVSRMDKAPGPMLDDYTAVLKNHHVAIAESDGGECLGLIVLIQQQDSILLDNVAVDPKVQGQGGGGHLLAYAEQQAKMLGYNCLNLYTHECMAENIDLYHRLGYCDVESKTVNGYARLYMRKMLV